MDAKVQATHYRWKDQPSESMKGTITRRIVTGERIMFGEIRFKKGDTVPRHAHDNEQFTYVVEGALKFWFGADGKQEVTVSAGEVVVIPSNLPHRAEALTIRSNSISSALHARIGWTRPTHICATERCVRGKPDAPVCMWHRRGRIRLCYRRRTLRSRTGRLRIFKRPYRGSPVRKASYSQTTGGSPADPAGWQDLDICRAT